MSNIAARPARANSKAPQIAIAGAGICGLALSLALHQAGFDPVVFERKSEAQLRGEGLFLTLAPNGINALRAIGLADAVIAAGLQTKGLALFNERGRQLGLMDYGQHAARFGAPSVTIRRGVLSAVLLDAVQAAGIDLRLGQGIDAIAETTDGVSVEAGSGTNRFDVLIACDGLRSTVRKLVFPDLPQPQYSGLIGTGGWVENLKIQSTRGIMNMTFGTRGFFGYQSEPGHPVYWFNSYPAPEGDVGPVADPVAYARFIAGLHRNDPLDNAAILAGVSSIDRNYPIYDMPELSRWHTSRVLLMGDAAHAVAPHSGQGASMAIEDALVLAACLQTEAATAFERFYGLRHDRTQTAIQIGRMSGSQKHAQSWLALRIRDLILPLVLPMGVKAQERMFGQRVDLAPLVTPSQ